MDGSVFALCCLYCGQSNQLSIKCNGCQVALYCNREHQCLHWETHKHQCHIIKRKLSGSLDPSFVPQINTANVPIIAQVNIANVPIVALVTTANVPIVAQVNTANVPIVAQVNTSNVPVVAQFNVNTPGNTMYNVQTNTHRHVQSGMSSHVQNKLQTNALMYNEHIQEKIPKPHQSNNEVHSSTPKSCEKINTPGRRGSPFHNSPPGIIPLKSFSTFPIFGAPKGISKDELIKKHADCAVRMLNNDGYCVIDELLGEEKVDNILVETESLLKSGIMKDGDVIQLVPGRHKEEQVRADKIVWVSGEEEICMNIKSLINVVDHLITFCGARVKQTIKGRTQAMIACYLGDGGGYKPHIDNSNKDGRAITVIYYLNTDWNKQRDGGMLKLHPLANPSFLEIEPIADRLLMFWSDSRTPHEVEASFRKRFAITLWYFDADEREEMRKNYVANLEKQFAGSSTAAPV